MIGVETELQESEILKHGKSALRSGYHFWLIMHGTVSCGCHHEALAKN
jgi:hypothetical protein